MRLFDPHVEGALTFGAIALMCARYARQTDLCVTMGAFAVDVGLAVFPFVSVQEKISFCLADEEQIFSVFLLALIDLSGEHPIKHENADSNGNEIQDSAENRIADKQRENGECEIDDEQCARKSVRAVSAPEKSR